MRHIRVLTYNIHKGFSAGNRRFILSRIREAIRSIHADVVLLQEVVGDRNGVSAQFEFLADELWPHYAYGKNAVYTSGHHGNAILSKFPILAWENEDVSTNRLERRGLLHATVEVPGRPIPLHLICCHLGLIEGERMEQVRRLCRRIGRMVPHTEPLVVGGDFNDWRERVSRPLRRDLGLQEVFETLEGSAPRTFPSWLPALRLDRIYFRGLSPLRAMRTEGRPWNQLSDHVAIWSELSF